MALARRSGQRVQANIWPGFVDAVTALLLVVIFVLSIFMIVQFVLRETISTQDSELADLAAQVTGLARALGLEQQASDRLRNALEGERAETARQAALIDVLRGESAEQQAEIATQAEAIEGFRARVADFEAQVASLIAERTDLRAAVTAGEAEAARLLSEQEALQAALARLRDERDTEAEAARLAAAQADALEALVADLRRTATEREASLQQLEAQLEGSMQALDEAERARLAEAAAAEMLRQRLREADTELTAMTLALEEKRREAEDTLTLLAAAEAAEKRLAGRLAELAATRDDVLSRAEERARLLALAQAELDREQAKSAESRREVALLNAQAAELRQQVARLRGLLDDSEARDIAQQAQIEALGSRLNAALARVAAEERARADLEEQRRREAEARAERLEGYQSEFFGRLREVLGGRPGVRIEGDRFVFDSEVLFAPGSADLSPEGRAQVANVAEVIFGVAGDIPEGLNWIIRVDGHTDTVPIPPGGRFADNWALSQARALSVVRYMIDELGLPANRLAAAGFGEYQPVNPADTLEARAQNRRIELKLTER